VSKEFPHSYEVCQCKQVTLGEIIYAIKEQGAKSIDEVGDITDAGTACGCCKSKEDDFNDDMELYIEDIVKKFAH
jgi:NAD(P)H-nitrite reductase large subunit